MKKVNNRILSGVFQDEESLISAAKVLREENVPIHDVYTPFPVHGLDDLLEIKRSRLPIVTFFAALLGCGLGVYFQIWTSKASWPHNIGGKPFNSFVAFIPVAFEITVLVGALVTVAFFLYRCGLFPGKKEELLDLGITNFNFVLAVELENAAIDVSRVEGILKGYGASEVKEHV